MGNYTFELHANNVYVWIANLKSIANTSLLSEKLLSEEEKIKKARFATPWLKSKFLYSHAILKLLLAKYLEISPFDIRYKYGLHQKPFINFKGKSLAFNMSHSNEWVAYGFSTQNEIGIDIEELNREIPSLIEISLLTCNQKERMELNSLSCPKQRKTYFLYNWTAREAFLKMLGVGIGNFLPNIYFDRAWNAFLPSDLANEKTSYHLVGKIQHILNKEYIASIAINQTSIQAISYELKDVIDLGFC